jgi:hypothetical protein
MKTIAAFISTAILSGCAVTSSGLNETFVAFPSPIDRMIDSASIEDYILALPPFEFHEESVEQFTLRVRNARKTEKTNSGRDCDELFVRGDGSAPAKFFALDRERKMLTIRIMNWEPGMAEETITMRRVVGGWMRGPRIVGMAVEHGESDEVERRVPISNG